MSVSTKLLLAGVSGGEGAQPEANLGRAEKSQGLYESARSSCDAVADEHTSFTTRSRTPAKRHKFAPAPFTEEEFTWIIQGMESSYSTDETPGQAESKQTQLHFVCILYFRHPVQSAGRSGYPSRVSLKHETDVGVVPGVSVLTAGDSDGVFRTAGSRVISGWQMLYIHGE